MERGQAHAGAFVGRGRAPSPLDPLLRADAEHLRALIELQAGVPADAHAILLAAVGELSTIDPERSAAMLVSAGNAASFAGDLEGEIAAGRLAERLRDELPVAPIALTMMTGIARLLSGVLLAGLAGERKGLRRMCSA